MRRWDISPFCHIYSSGFLQSKGKLSGIDRYGRVRVFATKSWNVTGRVSIKVGVFKMFLNELPQNFQGFQFGAG